MECKHCHTEFTPTHHRQRLCSKACRFARWEAAVKRRVEGAPLAEARGMIFNRDGWRCVHCADAGYLVVYLVMPDMGGVTEPQNLITVCRRCRTTRLSREDEGTLAAKIIADSQDLRWYTVHTEAIKKRLKQTSRRKSQLVPHSVDDPALLARKRAAEEAVAAAYPRVVKSAKRPLSL